MALLDRADIENLLARDPRGLALSIVRRERATGRKSPADRLVAELASLLKTRGALLLVREPERPLLI